MIIKTDGNNHYLYSDKLNRVNLVHPLLSFFVNLFTNEIDPGTWLETQETRDGKTLVPGYGEVGIPDLRHYYRKYLFFKEHGYLDVPGSDDHYNGRLTAGGLKAQLPQNRHIVFETTEACNLACKYCGYGEYYKERGKRGQRKIDSQKAKRLLDHMVEHWNSPANNSCDTPIRIGFYGGEPLLNFPFIEEIVAYSRRISLKYNHFTYGLTTNGLLLHEHMDFLAADSFDILVSLDGDEECNGYRRFADGSPSHGLVYENLEALAKKYPGYFEENVALGAVLHNKNSREPLGEYFKSHFNKNVNLQNLSLQGIEESRREEFQKLFPEVQDRPPGSWEIERFVECYSGCVVKDYHDPLTPAGEKKGYLPTGTCLPLVTKIFMTAGGRILPCERISQDHAMGYVGEKEVHIDFDLAAQKINSLFDRLVPQCTACFKKLSCPACVMQMEERADGLRCRSFSSSDSFRSRFAECLEYLEKQREFYPRIMKGEGGAV